jgi:uncharacterized protein YbjT (DUF2867 family)
MESKNNQKKVLVFGATGKQGGHVARHLFKKGHHVYAFTRHADSPETKELQKLGAKIVIGNFNDRNSIDKAVKDVDVVFSMTSPYEGGVDEEIKQGIVVVDSVKSNGKYLVFTSVASSDKNTGIPHFDSKGKIEQYIKKSGIEAAVIAPVFFMENLFATKQQLSEGQYLSPLTPNRKLMQVALDDIAAFAVLAIENKERFRGKRIDIASDDLTGTHAAEILTKIINKQIKYTQIPMEMIRKMMGNDMVTMFEWFEKEGYHVDTAALRREYPEIKWHTYESWAKEQNWESIFNFAGSHK